MQKSLDTVKYSDPLAFVLSNVGQIKESPAGANPLKMGSTNPEWYLKDNFMQNIIQVILNIDCTINLYLSSRYSFKPIKIEISNSGKVLEMLHPKILKLLLGIVTYFHAQITNPKESLLSLIFKVTPLQKTENGNFPPSFCTRLTI